MRERGTLDSDQNKSALPVFLVGSQVKDFTEVVTPQSCD